MNRFLLFPLAIILGVISLVGTSKANVIDIPIHPHGPSPVTTWPVPPVGPPFQHQHRTFHDPSGVASVHSYVADKSWMTGVQHLSPGSGGTHGDFAHGHMDVPTLYHFHNPPPIPAIPFEPEPIPLAAQAGIATAFNQWNSTSTAEINWPGSDDDTVPGTGIPIHSTINFVPGAAFTADHVHIEWSNEGLLDIRVPGIAPFAALAAYFPSIQTLRFSPNPNGIINGWYYGADVAGMGNALYDFPTVALHETGHVLAFDHWGSFAAGDIMQGAGLDVRGNPQSVLRNLNHAANHAARDVYSIPGSHPIPEPATLLLFFLGATMIGVTRRLSENRQPTAE